LLELALRIHLAATLVAREEDDLVRLRPSADDAFAVVTANEPAGVIEERVSRDGLERSRQLGHHRRGHDQLLSRPISRTITVDCERLARRRREIGEADRAAAAAR